LVFATLSISTINRGPDLFLQSNVEAKNVFRTSRKTCYAGAVSFIGPIDGSLVCARFHISEPDWKSWDPSDRAMFRMAYAADVLHVQEDPIGSNSGPEVDRVLKIAGVGPGNPWCAAIYTAYLVDSGVNRSVLPADAASVHAWGIWAGNRHRALPAPKRGCVGLIYHTPTTGHLTVVTGVSDSHVETISGNSDPAGSREAYEVVRHVYPLSAFAAFVDTRKLA
jgi:hypothetical protein